MVLTLLTLQKINISNFAEKSVVVYKIDRRGWRGEERPIESNLTILQF